MATEVREFRANRLTFRCREAGLAGEPAILLHGFAETSRVWEPLLVHLEARGFHALAPDQRGYSPGARPRGAQHYGYRSLASDVTALADAAGFDRFHLIGREHGAGVAWIAAQCAPERVASLTVVSSPAPVKVGPEPAPERAFAANDFAALRALLAGRAPEEVDEVLDVLRQHGALVAAFHWRRSNPPADTADPLAALGPVAVPTLRLPEQETARLCAEVEAHLRAHRVLGG